MATQLRTRLTIARRVDTEGPDGQRTAVDEDLGTRYGFVRPLAGGETFAGDERAEELTYEVRLRLDAITRGITAADALTLDDGRRLEVVSRIERPGVRKWLWLRCVYREGDV